MTRATSAGVQSPVAIANASDHVERVLDYRED